jgi:hypothetical protein
MGAADRGAANKHTVSVKASGFGLRSLFVVIGMGQPSSPELILGRFSETKVITPRKYLSLRSRKAKSPIDILYVDATLLQNIDRRPV